SLVAGEVDDLDGQLDAAGALGLPDLAEAAAPQERVQVVAGYYLVVGTVVLHERSPQPCRGSGRRPERRLAGAGSGFHHLMVSRSPPQFNPSGPPGAPFPPAPCAAGPPGGRVTQSHAPSRRGGGAPAPGARVPHRP